MRGEGERRGGKEERGGEGERRGEGNGGKRGEGRGVTSYKLRSLGQGAHRIKRKHHLLLDFKFLS